MFAKLLAKVLSSATSELYPHTAQHCDFHPGELCNFVHVDVPTADPPKVMSAKVGWKNFLSYLMYCIFDDCSKSVVETLFLFEVCI